LITTPALPICRGLVVVGEEDEKRGGEEKWTREPDQAPSHTKKFRLYVLCRRLFMELGHSRMVQDRVFAKPSHVSTVCMCCMHLLIPTPRLSDSPTHLLITRLPAAGQFGVVDLGKVAFGKGD
jgi:hypothetical protein